MYALVEVVAAGGTTIYARRAGEFDRIKNASSIKHGICERAGGAITLAVRVFCIKSSGFRSHMVQTSRRGDANRRVLPLTPVVVKADRLWSHLGHDRAAQLGGCL